LGLGTRVGLCICIKETKGIKEGGYYYIYSAIDTKSFKMQIQKKVKDLEEIFLRFRKFECRMQKIIETNYENEEPKQ
jgi:predicted transcriptional regulator